MLMIMSLIHEQYDSPQSMTPILLHSLQNLSRTNRIKYFMKCLVWDSNSNELHNLQCHCATFKVLDSFCTQSLC